jgi:hypothetical protein
MKVRYHIVEVATQLGVKNTNGTVVEEKARMRNCNVSVSATCLLHQLTFERNLTSHAPKQPQLDVSQQYSNHCSHDTVIIEYHD